MIKNLLFSAVLLFAAVAFVNAQCVPDSAFNQPGIYPDSATNLPHATVGQAYSAVMTAGIPHDTMGLPFDSIGVTSLTGLPTGFTYTTNSPSGYWPGGPIGGLNKGCLIITGNPVAGQEGTYPLTIVVDAVVIGTHNPTTLTYYKIVIDSAAGINENYLIQFELKQNVPNPFADKTVIEFVSSGSETYNLSVTNVLGREVYNKEIKAETGVNTVDFYSGNLSSGIYFYKLSNRSSSVTRKMNIEKY